tara:strand:+ start:58 stop:246 length:189 start_codon:yes stop_codon:yes gene_type:complete
MNIEVKNIKETFKKYEQTLWMLSVKELIEHIEKNPNRDPDPTDYNNLKLSLELGIEPPKKPF